MYFFSRQSPGVLIQDLFASYSEQGRRGRLGHYHEVVEANGVRLAFIAVDATTKPGYRRPFNFIGRLTDEDLLELKYVSLVLNEFLMNYQSFRNIAREAEATSDYQIWFGHYPTSAIVSSSPGTVHLPLPSALGADQ